MIDWGQTGQQAAELLSRYLQIKSVNPPGDVTEAAEFIEGLLSDRGLEVKRFVNQDGRINLVARLKGNGTRAPILLYHHMDVVPADPARWKTEPFSGEISDGYVYGRGAIDMKGMGIMQLLALELLQEALPDHSRDIIFYAAPDEETASEFGTQWMIENHWNEIAAEFVWDEGGFGLLDFFDEKPVFTVAVAEKKDLWVKLVAHGEPGHSGMPHGKNAVDSLLKALQKVQTINAHYEVHPITAELFAQIGKLKTFPTSFLLKHLHNPLIFQLLKPQITATPTISAMLRDTISITILKAGEKENVIPDTAEATLDIRLLPDRDPQTFLDGLKTLIADENIHFEVIHSPQETSTSDVNAEFYNALSSTLQTLVPQSAVAPMITPGSTDSSYFRRKGINSYGLFPAIITPDDLAGFHGIDERISIENLQLGTRVFFEVLKKMCV